MTRRAKKTVSGLLMPTVFVAQNGAQIKQNTKIGVTGCPPTRGHAKKARKAKGRKQKGKGKKKK